MIQIFLASWHTDKMMDPCPCGEKMDPHVSGIKYVLF